MSEKNNNDFQSTVEALFKGMDSFITTKTVVGDAIHIGENIILPLVDVSFGVAAGAFSNEAKNNGGLYVNMPGKIKVTLFNGNEEWIAYELYAAQAAEVLANGQKIRQNLCRMEFICQPVPDRDAGVFGELLYDFLPVSIFWIGASILSFVLALFVWNVKPAE